MTPEEIAALRRMSSTGGLVSLTGKELSALLLERDHHAAEAKALREAAESLLRGLLDTLSDGALWPCDCAGERGADDCESIAAVRVYDEPDTTDLCGHCAERLDRSHLENRPHAAPLRALRALLGRTP